MKCRYTPKTRATIKKTIRQKRDLISPFPKTMAPSSAKGLQKDKILSPPRDTLMKKTKITLLQTVGGCRNWNSVADASGFAKKINNITTKYYLSAGKFPLPLVYLEYTSQI